MKIYKETHLRFIMYQCVALASDKQWSLTECSNKIEETSRNTTLREEIDKLGPGLLPHGL